MLQHTPLWTPLEGTCPACTAASERDAQQDTPLPGLSDVSDTSERLPTNTPLPQQPVPQPSQEAEAHLSDAAGDDEDDEDAEELGVGQRPATFDITNDDEVSDVLAAIGIIPPQLQPDEDEKTYLQRLVVFYKAECVKLYRSPTYLRADRQPGQAPAPGPFSNVVGRCHRHFSSVNQGPMDSAETEAYLARLDAKRTQTEKKKTKDQELRAAITQRGLTPPTRFTCDTITILLNDLGTAVPKNSKKTHLVKKLHETLGLEATMTEALATSDADDRMDTQEDNPINSHIHTPAAAPLQSTTPATPTPTAPATPTHTDERSDTEDDEDDDQGPRVKRSRSDAAASLRVGMPCVLLVSGQELSGFRVVTRATYSDTMMLVETRVETTASSLDNLISKRPAVDCEAFPVEKVRSADQGPRAKPRYRVHRELVAPP